MSDELRDQPKKSLNWSHYSAAYPTTQLVFPTGLRGSVKGQRDARRSIYRTR